jgi:hypothetical protein
MSHLSGRCYCGRRIHWPRDVRIGDTWDCYRCGATWRLVPPGQGIPNTRTRSRPPASPPKVIVLPVVRETIRELPQPQGNPFIPPGRQLPGPSRPAQAYAGCLPAFLAMIGVGGCGLCWLVSLFV